MKDKNEILSGQPQDTAPTSAINAERIALEDGGKALLSHADVGTISDPHTPNGGTVPCAHPMADEPVEEQGAKHPVKQTDKLPSETLPLPAFQLRYITPKDVNSHLRRQVKTHTVNRNVSKRPMGIVESKLAPDRRLWQRVKTTDKWLIATFILACMVSGFSLWYFFEMHQTLLYGDANAHLLVARRVFDNLTPGLAQLGGIWLPLPHLLMVPLVWNDFLWHTGLAGSIVSMLCYLVTTVYIFLSARRLTNNSLASFIGTLVFILNPNILYLQSTPLSEMVLTATLAATCYSFVLWVQTDSTKYLILTAATTFLTTLSRYDGWFLFAAILVFILITGIVRHHRRTHIEGNLLIFASMGGIGIVLWFVWNGLIFDDPLYFQHGPFSAQAQQKDLINSHLLYTYHDLFQSIRYYLIDCIDIVGPLLFGIGVLAFLVFLAQRRFKPETFAALTFLSPILFYIVSLYTGQAALYLPTAVPGYALYTLFNARYGEVIVMPVAIFLACLVGSFSHPEPGSSTQRLSALKRTVGRTIFPLFCLGMVVGQSVWIVNTSIITLEDGIHGLACTPTYRIVIYLAQHYNGGKILEDLYASKIDTLEPTVGISFKNMIYEGSGHLWTEALSHPQSVVDWIIANPTNPNDAIAKTIQLKSDVFASQFSFVLQEENGLTLYHRNGSPPLLTHEVDRSIFSEHQRCGEYNPGRFGALPRLLD